MHTSVNQITEIVKLSTPPKTALDYTLSIKAQRGLSVEIDKQILKFLWDGTNQV